MNFIRYIIDYFRQRQNNVTVQRIQTERSSQSNQIPPGYIPVESFFDMKLIPGTSNSEIGIKARVLQSPHGEAVTYVQQQGVRLGCGHHIYIIDQIVTADSLHPGLGGQCPFCISEAADLYNQNLISLQQAEEMSLYCSLCASRCDICRRNNLCVRHTRQFNCLNGATLLLCPECLTKAENDKFFKKILAVMLLPFVDYNRLPPAKRNQYNDH